MADRESIWSVSRRFRSIYSAVFIALFVFGCVLAAIEADYQRPVEGWNWHTHMNTLIDMLGGYSIAAAAAAMVTTEILEVMVMLADALREIIDDKRKKRVERVRQEERERLLQSGVPAFLCPIWGTPATLFPTARPAAVFCIDSKQAGGKYEISLQLLAQIVNEALTFTEQDRETVTEWLANQRSAGVDLPVLDDKVVRDLIGS